LLLYKDSEFGCFVSWKDYFSKGHHWPIMAIFIGQNGQTLKILF